MTGILLSYKTTTFQALNSDTFDFELTILKGFIFKREKVVKYGIPNFQSVKKFTDHWDKLIKSKEKIKF